MSRARVALALAGSALALAAAAPAANAAFSLTAPCSGSAVSGRGASFQASAQQGFIGIFQTSDFCGAGAPAIGYDPAGSGGGRRSLGERGSANPLGARDPQIRYAGTDEPPTVLQTDQIEKGPVTDAVSNADVTAADDGDIHVLPVAVGANAIDVNYPDGCTIPAASLANTASTDQTDRIKLPATMIEAAFYADTGADTWGEIVPGITGTPTDPAIVAAGFGADSCPAVPVRRVVRTDDSGTTFVLKDWLGKVNASRSPTWASFSVTPNTGWPNAVNQTIGGVCPVNANLCKSAANATGNGPLLDVLNNVDGGIGYADIATSRAKGFESSPSTPGPGVPPDTKFWVPIVNSSNASFEPTKDPLAYKSGVGARGANCPAATTVFNNIPAGADPTLGNWAATSGTAGPTATVYPICALTYVLAWDDNAAVYGATAAEEAKARTEVDFLKAAASAIGQAILEGRDYAPLPSNLRTIAQNGINAINWNKKGGTTTPPPPPPPPPPPVVPPVVPPVGPPPVSNVFTIAKATTTSTTKSASIVLSIAVPGPGALSAVATSSYKVKRGRKTTTRKVSLGSVKGTVTAAGTVKLTIKVGAKALADLKRAKQLKVLVKVTYTPTGGTANSATKTVTLKAAKKAKKKK